MGEITPTPLPLPLLPLLSTPTAQWSKSGEKVANRLAKQWPIKDGEE